MIDARGMQGRFLVREAAETNGRRASTDHAFPREKKLRVARTHVHAHTRARLYLLVSSRSRRVFDEASRGRGGRTARRLAVGHRRQAASAASSLSLSLSLSALYANSRKESSRDLERSR